MLERPLREALLAFEFLVQERKLEQYRHDCLMFAQGAAEKPPDPPAHFDT